MTNFEIEQHCKLNEECEKIIRTAMERFSLSIRQYHKILKISRTIADITNSVDIQKSHIMEALGYR